MTLLELIVLLIVAGVFGAIAQAITGFSRGGCLLAIGVGFVGALLGTWIARLLGLPAFFVLNIGGTGVPIIWTIIGGALFTAVLAAVSRR
jgi:uncharacterized membrane protein YeaQ/YmgE (transglycosylase-associated protein family)